MAGRWTALHGDAAATRDLVAYDTATGAEQVLAPASALVLPGSKEPMSVDEYALSSDKSKLLVFTNTRKVWRTNARGDYWVLTLDAGTPGALKKLGGDAPEASVMYAKFSPDGTRVAYVRAQNLYVEDLGSGRILPLTKDGGGDIVNGTGDWVNEEEFSIYDGFKWSPDGRRIAFWQFDTSGVERFTLINNTAELYPRVIPFPYPKPGTKNSAVRVGIVASDGGAAVWVKSAEPLRDHYIPRMEWADERTLVLQNMNRLQNRNDVMLADVTSGDARRILRDEGRGWVEHMDEVAWLHGGREFVWVSESDGWRHAYAVKPDGSGKRLLTRFDGDLASITAVDTAAGNLYFIASPANATQRYLYAARLDGDGTVRRVTPAEPAGYPRLQRFTQRTLGDAYVVVVSKPTQDRDRRTSRASIRADAGRQRGPRQQSSTHHRPSSRVPEGGSRRRRRSGRLHAQAEGLRRRAQVPGRRLRLRRACWRDGQ